MILFRKDKGRAGQAFPKSVYCSSYVTADATPSAKWLAVSRNDRVLFQAEDKNFLFATIVFRHSLGPTTSFPLNTGGSIPMDKATTAWNWTRPHLLSIFGSPHGFKACWFLQKDNLTFT
jgi:hypothetical protein